MPATLASVGLYAALNMLILFWFVGAISRLRSRGRIWIGDGGDAALARAMRGHANAAENMPIMLVMLLVAALLGAPAIAIHALGIVFTLGRALHALHFVQARAPQWQRGAGFTLSFLAQLVAVVGLIGHALRLIG